MKYHINFDLELKKNPYTGTYIALEGIDGSGKTTQAEKIAEYFEKQGKTVIHTREPRSEGLVGSIVREVLQAKIKIPSIALQYLFSADRAIHHEEIIVPSLKAGKVVISDRCFWSAVPYGIMDRTESSYELTEANQILIAQSILSMYHQFIVPDHTFYLKISVETAVKRLEGVEKTQEIYEKKETLQKITSGYDWLVEHFPEAITKLDGEKKENEVIEDILFQINK